jgi:hypothetical protein
MNFDLNNKYTVAIIAGVIGILLSTFIMRIIRFVKNLITKIIFFFLGKKILTNRLASYKTLLLDSLCDLSHPWMKENQTLKDILVPITFEIGTEKKKEDLHQYINRLFNYETTPRIVILGKPGSGKSISLRTIAQTILNDTSKRRRIPVLLNFSDIKRITDGVGLRNRIIEQLNNTKYSIVDKKPSITEEFVDNNLKEGKIFLLFDGYDELEKTNRKEIAHFLNGFLKTNLNIPVIISSRSSVYELEEPFKMTCKNIICTAPFNKLSILRFLTQWKFENNKSPQDLFEQIKNNKFLLDLASNPLMLTIISYLYSLKDRDLKLPNNKVDFYRTCTEALLKNWDESQHPDRKNRFKAEDKNAILQKIAYMNITLPNQIDDQIDEEALFQTTRSEMDELKLNPKHDTVFIDELIQNSGLFQFIPPNEYKFPHRTFLEYYTATYFLKKKQPDDILELYFKDREKYKEIFLLYIGQNKNIKDITDLLLKLKNDFIFSLNENKKHYFILFSALTQSPCSIPDITEDILELAFSYLHKYESSELIEEMGYLLGKPNFSYYKKVKEILLWLLDQQLSDNAFHQVLNSLLHSTVEDYSELIIENINKLQVEDFFSKTGEKDRILIHKIIESKIPNDTKANIIEGLRNASNFEILLSLLIENKEEHIRKNAAYGLLRMSKLDGFNTFLDNYNINLLDNKTNQIIESKYKEWGWRWKFPVTENGKKMAILICHFGCESFQIDTSNYNYHKLKSRYYYFSNNIKERIEISNHFRFLTASLFVEKKHPLYESDLLVSFYNSCYSEYHDLDEYLHLYDRYYSLDELKVSTTKGMKRFWAEKKTFFNFYQKIISKIDSFIILLLILLYSVCIILNIGLILFSKNISKENIFSNFTSFYIPIHFFILYLTGVIFCLFDKEFDDDNTDAATIGFFGLPLIAIRFGTRHPGLIKIIPFFILLIGITQFLLPVHNNMIISFVASYYLIIAIYIHDYFSFTSSWIFQFNSREIRKFLKENDQY